MTRTAEQVQFEGTRVETNLPYGILRGNVAEQVQKSLLEAKFDDSDTTLAQAGFAIKGKTGVYPQGELWGSTPDVHMALWHYVDTQSLGFKPATPQQFAQIYNGNPDFIRRKLWADVQMIMNPNAVSANGRWEFDLKDQILSRIDTQSQDKLIAVPYSAIKPIMRGYDNGHLGEIQNTGYTPTEDAAGKLRVLDWTPEQAKGFKFNRFDEVLGTPIPEENGERTFYGLSNKIFSALDVNGILVADGGRLFGDSDGGARVVGWETA